MCELASDFLRNRRLRHLNDRQVLWEQIEQFTQVVHHSLDLRETALVVANEGRRLIGCDRVSVAFARGRRYVIEAVSGLDSIDRRASEVRALGALARAAVATGESLFYSGDDSQLPPQVERALHDYVDRAHAKSLAVIPLTPPEELRGDDRRRRLPRPLGALIIEQFHQREFEEPTSRRIATVVEHGALALTNAQEHSRLFLLPLWKMLGKALWVLEARTLPKAVLAAVVVIAAVAALVITPKDFTLAARGALQPVERRHVFAGVEGVVMETLAEHGAAVAAGDALLLLRNTDLEVEIASLIGQRTTAQEQILSAQRTLLDNARLSPEERERLAGRLLELQETTVGLDRQLELLRQKERQLWVRSPIAGEVVTWRVRDKLMHRPVERGQTLLTVVNPSGPWELELRMPERRVGHLVRAADSLGEDLAVSFHLATHPGQEFQGHVTEIHRTADVQGDDGNTVLVRVALEHDQLPDLRPGATANARVHCGQRPLGYVWLHEAIEAVQTRLMLWF
jgi:multidrug efflux pump subunit AcrA (membrane-fusion protein)